jgi:hypothetical protein
MTSGVNGGGEAPFQAFLPVLVSNTTVDNSYASEVGWGEVTPPEPKGGTGTIHPHTLPPHTLHPHALFPIVFMYPYNSSLRCRDHIQG